MTMHHHGLLVQVRQIKDCSKEAEQHFSETGGAAKTKKTIQVLILCLSHRPQPLV